MSQYIPQTDNPVGSTVLLIDTTVETTVSDLSILSAADSQRTVQALASSTGSAPRMPTCSASRRPRPRKSS